MQWTNQQIATAIGVLGRYSRVKDALPEIERVTCRPVNSDQLKHALKQRGHSAPTAYLGKDLVGNKAREVRDEILKDLDRDIQARLYYQDTKAPGPATIYRQFEVPFSVPSITDFEPKPITKIMVCPDAHHPFVDRLAWNTFLEACRVVKPDVLVCVGDFGDILSLSAHQKKPKDNTKFKKELAGVLEALDQIQALGIPRVIFIGGNHEYRIDRYIAAKAPELDDMLNIPDLFDLEARGFEYVKYGDFVRIGEIAFTHDVGRCGVNAARQSLQDFGDNLVFGHSHRAQVVYGGTVEGKTHVCMNVGWLGDYEAIDYRNRPTAKREWQHAFGFVYQTEDGTSFCNLVPIINGRCVVDGKLVDGRS